MKYLNQDWYALLSRRAASKRGGRLFWLVLAVFVLTLNLYAPAQPTVTERLLASAIIFLAFGMIWRWIYRGAGEAEFGFWPLFLIFYALLWAIPIFTLKWYSMEIFTNNSLPDPIVTKSLLLALAGLISLSVGYHYPGRRRVARVLPKIRMQWRNKDVVQLVSLCFAGFGLCAFLVALNLKLSPAIQAFVNEPSELFYLAITALVILQLEGELNWVCAALLWLVLIPIHSVMGLAQGTLGFGMLETAALIIAYATMRRRMPWAVFVVGFAVFFFIQPIKANLRQTVWKGGWMNPEQDQGEKLEALFAAGGQGLTVVQTLDLGDLVAVASQRLASIMILATVVSRTPQDTPYWKGASYYPLLFVPVPRFLDPEKPSELPGNVLGHQYGMISPDDYRTSINLMQLLELYGNFGPLGVVLGSILIGMAYRTINDLFLHRGSGLGALVGGMYLLSHLSNIENSTSVIFGGLLLEFITVLIFYLAIRFAEAVFAARNLRRVPHHTVAVWRLEISENQT